MTDPNDKPTGATTNLWGDVFIPKPALEEGLLSNVPQATDQDDEIDPYLDAYYGEVE